MVKTVFVGLISFICISTLLILIGNLFDFKILMFSFYKETKTGFEVGGSIIPFIIGIICSYFIGNYYQKKRLGY